MSLVLNTNIDALIAQNSLTGSGSQLTTALQQLSSGLQINSAADNAAGYAIAQGMTSQINGLNTATNNTNDGISLTQTAQGSLQQITNDLQTMRNLAVQSLNATNSSQDRADLNQQFQQLAADINQVSQTASFNGVNLLDGSFQGATFQVGANAGQSITVGSIASASTTQIGNYYTGVTAPPSASAISVLTPSGSTAYSNAATQGTAGVYNAGTLASTGSTGGLGTAVAGSSVTLTVNVDGTNYTTNAINLTGTQSTDLKSIAAAINQAVSPAGGLVATVNSAGTGIQMNGTAAAGTGHIISFSVASATNASGNAVTAGSGTLASLGVDSADVIGTYSTGATLASNTLASTAATITLNSSTAVSGTYAVSIGTANYTASYSNITTATGTGGLAATIANSLNANTSFSGAGYTATANTTTGAITISSTSTTAFTATGTFGAVTGTGSGTGTGSATVTGLALGTSTATAASKGTGTPTASSNAQYLSGVNVTTVDQSNLTLISIDNALQQIATSGAALGAYQNRFQAAVSGLQTDSQNLSAAKSQIVDTNYAQATSNLSKAQILQQAGTAMVAQANTIPQNILTLLQKLP
jgi:flagellin